METENNTAPDSDKEAMCVCPFCGSYQIDPEGGWGQDTDGKKYTFPVCDDCNASAPSVDAWNKRTVTPHMRNQLDKFKDIDLAVALEIAMRSICDLATDRQMAERLGVVTELEYDQMKLTERVDSATGYWTNCKDGFWEHTRTADF